MEQMNEEMNMMEWIENEGFESSEEIDEDLIPAFNCIKCGMNCCKDEIYKKLDGMKCICIDCGYKNE